MKFGFKLKEEGVDNPLRQELEQIYEKTLYNTAS